MCVASTATVVVSVNPTPEIQSSLTEDICSGDTFNYTIEANFASGVNYSWSRPEITELMELLEMETEMLYRSSL